MSAKAYSETCPVRVANGTNIRVLRLWVAALHEGEVKHELLRIHKIAGAKRVALQRLAWMKLGFLE